MTPGWRPGFALETGGHRLTLEEAATEGARIFEPLAKPPSRPLEPVALSTEDRAAFVCGLIAARRRGWAVVPLAEPLGAAERQRRIRLADAGLACYSRSEWMRVDGGNGHPLGSEYLVFTSGSEGPAKGVLLGEEAFARHTDFCKDRILASPMSRSLLSLSPGHVGGLAMVLRGLHLGATLVVPDAPPTDDLDELVARAGVTHMSLVPTQLQRWVRARRGRAPPSLSSVLVGGGPAPPALIEEALSQGIPVQATYGLTEAASQVATASAGSPPGSVGPPLPGIEVRIVDERGRDAAVEEVGRVVVRTPSQMLEYHADVQATARMLHDGWLWTQDRGRLDAAGNLWIVGRWGRVINTGGKKVDPALIEAAISSLPGVREACVVGLPDAEWGERVAAAVCGDSVDAGSVRAALEGRVAPFEVPKTVDVWPDLPRTSAGKVDAAAVARRLRLRDRR